MAENFCETPARAAGIPDIERGALIPEAFRWVAEAKGSRNRLTGLHTNKQKKPAGWAGRVFLRAIKKRDLVRCGADMGRRVRMPPEVIIGICRLVMLLFPCGAATGFGGDFR